MSRYIRMNKRCLISCMCRETTNSSALRAASLSAQVASYNISNHKIVWHSHLNHATQTMIVKFSVLHGQVSGSVGWNKVMATNSQFALDELMYGSQLNYSTAASDDPTYSRSNTAGFTMTLSCVYWVALMLHSTAKLVENVLSMLTNFMR